ALQSETAMGFAQDAFPQKQRTDTHITTSMPQGMQEENHRNQRQKGKGGWVEPCHRAGTWRLLQIKTASQIPQNEIFKGDRGAGAQILDVAFGTEGLNLGKIVYHFLAIQFEHASIHR